MRSVYKVRSVTLGSPYLPGIIFTLSSSLSSSFLSLSGNKFSSTHALLLVAGVWGYASIFAIGPLARWGQYSAEPYGTACCIDWYAPAHDALAMSYIICLFLFCYVVPCTIIFLSYTFILLTVRGSRQAVQQHVSPQTKTTNAHSLIVKVRGERLEQGLRGPTLNILQYTYSTFLCTYCTHKLTVTFTTYSKNATLVCFSM